jgi:hypothetical protein
LTNRFNYVKILGCNLKKQRKEGIELKLKRLEILIVCFMLVGIRCMVGVFKQPTISVYTGFARLSEPAMETIEGQKVFNGEAIYELSDCPGFDGPKRIVRYRAVESYQLISSKKLMDTGKSPVRYVSFKGHMVKEKGKEILFADSWEPATTPKY